MDSTRTIAFASFAAIFVLLAATALVMEDSEASTTVWEVSEEDGMSVVYQDGSTVLRVNLVSAPMTNASVIVDGESYGARADAAFNIALKGPLDSGVHKIAVIASGYQASCTLTGYTSYSVTLEQAVGGTVSASPMSGPSGTEVSLSYTLAEGYEFKEWKSSDVTISGNTFEMPGKDVTVTAVFEKIPEYTITASASENGSISPSGEKKVLRGGSQPYVISANPGYEIEDVKVDGASVGAVASYGFENVTADHTIAATFRAQSPTVFTVTITAGTGGSVSKTSVSAVSGTSIVASGDTLTIGQETVTATAASGYSFKEWTGMPSGGTVTGNMTVTASFAEDAPTPTIYTVTVTAGTGGSVSKTGVSVASGTSIVASGSTLTIGQETVTATAASGYSFSAWSGVPSGGTVIGDVTVTASFTKDTPTPTPTTKYTVTVTTDGHGTAYASPSSASSGTRVTLTASPSQGYVFKEWQSSDVTVSGSTFTMPSKNVTVRAVFEESSTTVPVTGITISDSELTLVVGGSAALTASVKPSNATDRNVIWSSSDTSVVSVSGGVVKALKAGTAVVTVTSEDGGFTAACTVTVTPADYVVPADGGQVEKAEMEKAAESVKENPGQKVVIAVDGDSISIPADPLKDILDLGSEVTVTLSEGSVTIPKGSVAGLGSGEQLKLVVESSETPSGFDLPDGAVVVDVSMFLGDSKVSTFGTPITVSIPVTLAAGQDASKLKVFHLADDGTVTDMKAVYDADAGAMVFTTDHLSVYAVAESVGTSSDDGDSGSAMWIAVVAVIVIVIAAAVLVLRRRP